MQLFSQLKCSEFCKCLFYIVLTFICFIGSALHAQYITKEKVRLYNSRDGLHDAHITCIAQDKRGNLWLGTNNGVSKFDGKKFTAYLNTNNSKKAIFVSVILCDQKGNIWLGTNENYHDDKKAQGLFRFDGQTLEQFTREKDGLPANEFDSHNCFLYEDSLGNIWGSAGIEVVKYGLFLEKYLHGVFKYDWEKIQTKYYEYKPRIVIIKELHANAEIDTDGYIWTSPREWESKKSLRKLDRKGQLLQNFNYVQSTCLCADIAIDKKNVIWITYPDSIIAFDGMAFKYYDEQILGTRGFKSISFDSQGLMWIATWNGLLKIDIIPPILKRQNEIPSIVKSPNISLSFHGDDGESGTSLEDLKYYYRLNDKRKWIEAINGQVVIDSLHDMTNYILKLKVTDNANNSTIDSVRFQTKFNFISPLIKWLNKDEFRTMNYKFSRWKAVFKFSGKDDITPSEELVYSYKFEKESGEVIQEWSDYQKTKEVIFNHPADGKYKFFIKAKDKNDNESDTLTVPFIFELFENKPKIGFSNLLWHHIIEQNQKPLLKTEPVKEKINNGWFSFQVVSQDPRPEKQDLQYSVRIDSLDREWTIFKRDGHYEYHKDLPDGIYTIKAQAKDQAGYESVVIDTSIEITGANQFPKTSISRGQYLNSDGKIVATLVTISGIANMPDCYFSIKQDSLDWTPFQKSKTFEFRKLTTGKHLFQVLAKNEYGIDQTPAIIEIDYERVPDVPIIQFTDSNYDTISVDSIIFKFQGEDDMNEGNKTPVDSMRYQYRFIPTEPYWSDITYEEKILFKNLPNGSYFFQVKTLDKSNNESVVHAEHFFTVHVIPFYQRGWFLWTISIGFSIVVAVISILLAVKLTKKQIYEQRYNPYIVGEAVHDPNMFFGRENLMKDVYQSLKANSVFLTGERRIGKTTLLEHINKNIEKPFFSFFCNLEAVKEEQFFSRIMQHLISKIRLLFPEKSLGITLCLNESKQYEDIDFEEDIETVLQFLRKYYDQNVAIIMCLDEIDATQGFSAEIHQSLRNIFQSNLGNIRMVAAGVSIKRGEWYLPTSPWYNFFEFKKIKPFTKEHAEQLITQPVKGFYKFDSKAINYILIKTDSKPFYLQNICKRTINKILNEKRRKVNLDDVEKIYFDFIHNELNSEFEIFWEKLSESSQKVILNSANGEKKPVSKDFKQEILNNEYNHGHKIILIEHEQLKLSSIFYDWLKINYLRADT